MSFRRPATSSRLQLGQQKRKPKTSEAVPLYIGVDSDKRPIKTYTNAVQNTGGPSTAQRSITSRYPNYLPQLKAKRVETDKQILYKAKIKERLQSQLEAEEAVLNKQLIQKVLRISPTARLSFLEESRQPSPPTSHRLSVRPEPKKLVGVSEVQSLYRATPGVFSLSAHPVVQLELAMKKRNTASAPPPVNPPTPGTSVTDSEVSDYLKKRIRKHQH